MTVSANFILMILRRDRYTLSEKTNTERVEVLGRSVPHGEFLEDPVKRDSSLDCFYAPASTLSVPRDLIDPGRALL